MDGCEFYHCMILHDCDNNLVSHLHHHQIFISQQFLFGFTKNLTINNFKFYETVRTFWVLINYRCYQM